jgi:predicted MFS family arabinose efflux permease
MSSGFQMSNQINLMQQTDPIYFGRVMSLVMTAFGMQMVVGFPAGAFADWAGERVTLIILAACCLVVVVAGYLAWRSLQRSQVAAVQPDW